MTKAEKRTLAAVYMGGVFIEEPSSLKPYTDRIMMPDGYNYLIENGRIRDRHLKYDEDWNWLMELVIAILMSTTEYMREEEGMKAGIRGTLSFPDKLQLFDECIKYIQWFNQKHSL